MHTQSHPDVIYKALRDFLEMFRLQANPIWNTGEIGAALIV